MSRPEGEGWTTGIAHRLRRVQTGHGFGMAPGDDRLSTSVFVLLFPEELPDEKAFKGAMTPEQARALGMALLSSADAAEAEPIP